MALVPRLSGGRLVLVGEGGAARVDNAQHCHARHHAGANVIVAGTSVFRSKDFAAAIADLRGPVDAALARL